MVGDVWAKIVGKKMEVVKGFSQNKTTFKTKIIYEEMSFYLFILESTQNGQHNTHSLR